MSFTIYSVLSKYSQLTGLCLLFSTIKTADLERGAAGIAEIFGITEHLNVTMGADSTRGALHEETVYGERYYMIWTLPISVD